MDNEFVAGTYKRFPVEIVSGKGSKVVDVNGKEYVDMGSGIGVTSFGIADDVWQAAITAQLGKLQHISNLYYTEPCAKLAKMLCERTGLKKVFFANSGAEANEGAIKVARKYAAEKKGADHYTIITLNNSFHGRTLTTLAATGQDHFHKLFQPLTPGFVSTPANDFEALKELALQTKAAGIMMECIQGEGGGLPIGAVLMGEKVQHVLGYGDHGSTYGGNPVCCAGAISIIERMDEAFLSRVDQLSDYMFSEFRGAKGVESVAGMGLMVGLKTTAPAADVVKECINRGVLCLTAKDKVRLLPALNIPREDLEFAVETIKAVAAELGG